MHRFTLLKRGTEWSFPLREADLGIIRQGMGFMEMEFKEKVKSIRLIQ
jgi:hypothetical protein